LRHIGFSADKQTKREREEEKEKRGEEREGYDWIPGKT